MSLSVEDVLERVRETEAERAEWRRDADHFVDMWALETDKSPTEVRALERREQVTLPTPHNVVNLVKRILGVEPKIEILAAHATEKQDRKAERRERWVGAVWNRAQKQQNRMFTMDWAWQLATMGRAAARVLWVYDVLPEHLRNRRLPFVIQPLDPRQVGVREGPLYTESAYHKYRETRGYVRQYYPHVALVEDERVARGGVRLGDDVEVVDYYWTSAEGRVWHCVVVGDQFAKPPYETEYPEIPIVEACGDSAPVAEESRRGMSMLYALRELYPYQNRLASKLATGLLYYFDPVWWTKNVHNDIEIGPGMTVPLGSTGEMGLHQPQANLPLVQAMLQIVDGQIQQATFPGVMYGEQPGQVQAGYGINILAKQAGGRIAEIRVNMENMIERLVGLVLAVTKQFLAVTPELNGGVAVWGREEGSRAPYSIVLKLEDIEDFDCEVTLAPDLPTDDAARVALWMQMQQAGLISAQTFRDMGIDVPLPKDEDLRVATEQTLTSEQFLPKYQLQTIKERFPTGWEWIVAGTELEELARREAQWAEELKRRKLEEGRQKAMDEYMRTGKLPRGWRMTPDGRVLKSDEEDEAAALRPWSGGGGPGMMPPGGGMMGAGDPSMPPMMPPGMAGGMMPPGMGGGMVPPGGAGPMMPGGGPGGPLEMMGGVDVPGGAMTLGIPPGPEQGLQSGLVQGDMSSEELLRRLAGG